MNRVGNSPCFSLEDLTRGIQHTATKSHLQAQLTVTVLFIYSLFGILVTATVSLTSIISPYTQKGVIERKDVRAGNKNRSQGTPHLKFDSIIKIYGHASSQKITQEFSSSFR